MTAFKSRIAKLEEIRRLKGGAHRIPGIKEETVADIRRVAAVCTTWQELAAFLASLLPIEQRAIVPIDDKQRRDAVLGTVARSIMDEVHGNAELLAG